MDIVRLFQNRLEAIERHPNIVPPRYIVSTTKLIGVDYNLHAAKRLVIVDAEWMNRDHEEAKKRINRLGQTYPTYTYLLVCVGSQVEQTIYARHDRQATPMKLALNPDKFRQNTYIRGVGDDEDDESVGVEEDDLYAVWQPSWDVKNVQVFKIDGVRDGVEQWHRGRAQ